MPPAPDRPSVTFVCCVEAGPLERSTLVTLRSLRRFGGRWADAPVVAVTPRFGPPLEKATRVAFDDLNVRHVSIRPPNRYPWHQFVNKPLSCVYAEQHADTDVIGWLDGDLLFLDEPVDFALGDNVDFLASPTETVSAGLSTTGPGHANDPYWLRAMREIGVDPAEVPMIAPEGDPTPVRLYYNAGLFLYRRAAEFGRAFLDDNVRCMDARFAHHRDGTYVIDQVLLGLTALRLGLRRGRLADSHNYLVASWQPETLAAMVRDRPRVVHFHDALKPPFRRDFAAAVGQLNPDAAALLGDWIDAPYPRIGAQVRKALRALRAFQRERFRRKCEAL